jgi:hypothetical protein
VSASVCTTAGRVEVPKEVAGRLPDPAVGNVALLWSRMVPLPRIDDFVPMAMGGDARVIAVERDVPFVLEGEDPPGRVAHLVVATLRVEGYPRVEASLGIRAVG